MGMTSTAGVAPVAGASFVLDRALSRTVRSVPMATTVFSVVGEHRTQPSRLLLLGEDGQFYAFAASAGQPTAVQPSDEWELDPDVFDPAPFGSSDDDL